MALVDRMRVTGTRPYGVVPLMVRLPGDAKECDERQIHHDADGEDSDDRPPSTEEERDTGHLSSGGHSHVSF